MYCTSSGALILRTQIGKRVGLKMVTMQQWHKSLKMLSHGITNFPKPCRPYGRLFRRKIASLRILVCTAEFSSAMHNWKEGRSKRTTKWLDAKLQDEGNFTKNSVFSGVPQIERNKEKLVLQTKASRKTDRETFWFQSQTALTSQ